LISQFLLAACEMRRWTVVSSMGSNASSRHSLARSSKTGLGVETADDRTLSILAVKAVSAKTIGSSRRRLLETKNCRQLGWVATTTGDFVLQVSVLLAGVDFVFTPNLVDPQASISCRTCATVAALERPGVPFGSGAVSVEPRRRRLRTSAYGLAGRVFVEQRRQRVVVRVLEPVDIGVDERHTQETRIWGQCLTVGSNWAKSADFGVERAVQNCWKAWK